MNFSKKSLLFLSIIFIILLLFVIFLNHIKFVNSQTELSGIYGRIVYAFDIQDDKIICTYYANTPDTPGPFWTKMIETYYFENDTCIKHDTKVYHSSNHALNELLDNYKNSYKNDNIKTKGNIVHIEHSNAYGTKEEVKENTINTLLNRLSNTTNVFIKENGIIRVEQGKAQH